MQLLLIMFKPRKQIWRDNTEPPKNYIWERLNESGSYIGTYEYNGIRWVKIKDKSDTGSTTTCTCDGKFVFVSKAPNVVYGNDKEGRQTIIKYSDSSVNNSIAIRTTDGRLKSRSAKESDDVITLNDFSWNE